VLLHLRVRGAGGNLDLELDQELHVVVLLSDSAEWRLDPHLATGVETPMFFTPLG
jgi:hypothetical protein